MNDKYLYVYPKLPAASGTYSFVRFSGSGLANCLFVYARAIKYAHVTGSKLITPTWFNISLGPYIRHQTDKRHYLNLFNSSGEISGLDKLLKLLFCKKQIHVIEGLGTYFADLLDDSQYIASYIKNHVCPQLLQKVEISNFTHCVAVHVRLGDYPENVRVPIEWYKQKINNLQKANPEYKFYVFSDGKDDELAELTSIRNVKRAYFGNAIADIFAISKCCYLIGSDSTFSGWGAFLGQVPCCFYRKHFGPVLKNSSNEIVESNENSWI